MDLSKLHVSIVPHLLPTLSEPQLRLDLTVHNSFDHAVTIQTWDSPLDPRCALLGVIEMFDTTTDTLLPMDKVFFSRQMPPPHESFVQIDGHKEATNSVSISNVRLASGKDYRLEAKGRWKAVWDHAIERIEAKSLETLAGVCTGDFSSNVVTIRL